MTFFKVSPNPLSAMHSYLSIVIAFEVNFGKVKISPSKTFPEQKSSIRKYSMFD